jgi:alkylation response protein AidB-like acyl-CoA dehydrogenase
VRLVAREYAHLALAEAVKEARRAHGDQRPFGSLTKISMSMIAAMASDLSARIDGMALRAPASDDVIAASAESLLRSPKSGIAGGTTEIQKNTIARHILRLDERPGVS